MFRDFYIFSGKARWNTAYTRFDYFLRIAVPRRYFTRKSTEILCRFFYLNKYIVLDYRHYHFYHKILISGISYVEMNRITVYIPYIYHGRILNWYIYGYRTVICFFRLYYMWLLSALLKPCLVYCISSSAVTRNQSEKNYRLYPCQNIPR